MSTIFLCYASEDKPIAESIQLALVTAGHQVFFDEETLHAGDDYNGQIRKAISSCDAFVFVATLHSIKEGRYTLTELKFIRQRWPSPAGRVLAVNVANLAAKTLPLYLTAATLLNTEGNVAAEVRAAVEVMLDRQRSVDTLSLQLAEGKRRKNKYAAAAVTGFALALAFAVVAYPRARLAALGCQVDLADVREMWLREGQDLRIADGWRCMLLKIDDVKVKTLNGTGPGEVHASFSVESAAVQRRVIGTSEPRTVVLHDREYQIQVHDFSDVQRGADQAQVTVSLKK